MSERTRAETIAACPACGEPTGPGDAFCEKCGTELAPAVVSTGTPGFVPSCPVCSVDPSIPQPVAITADGYCESCGRKVPTGRDHTELDLGVLAGVTDRGIRHSRNEDAMALATAETPAGPVAIAVVCDGVSSSPRPDDASLAGAQAGVRVLLNSVRVGDGPRNASLAAVRTAAAELAGLAGPGGAPSATYVSLVVGPDPVPGAAADSGPATSPDPDVGTGPDPGSDAVTADSPATPASRPSSGAVTVCWLGDSRAYWLSAEGSRRLTTDDSLAQEMIAAGLADEAEAMASPQAHVITRWLGADIAEPQARITRFEPTGPGVVLACSDGLWNYLPEAAELAEHALPAAGTDPLRAARELVQFAIDAGGMDNITVVLVPFPLRSSVT
ncbi:MAG: zinc ribbon domain-containing protein [Streptosporangiaceae bacterium]|nr:zinc ribbon domain-containing protein [Streptosporangiaceae bacterium]